MVEQVYETNEKAIAYHAVQNAKKKDMEKYKWMIYKGVYISRNAD